MNRNKLLSAWKAEEAIAHIHGWDFSHIAGRYTEQDECFRPIRFFDVGALVWFARIIQWEFPDFSMDTHLENLLNAQRILDEKGSIDGSIHRFLLVTKKG